MTRKWIFLITFLQAAALQVAHASTTVYLPNLQVPATGTTSGGKNALDVNVISSVTAANASVGPFGSATPASGTVIGGTDGTLLRAIKVDSGGVIQTNRSWSLLDSGDSVAASQKGVWSVGRTWSLSSGSDSVASVQSGTWSNRITDGTNTAAVTVGLALKVDGSAVTQPVSAASLPLPTGAASSANQSTANTSLSSIDTKLTGVASASNQSTGNTSLSSIDTKSSTIITNTTKQPLNTTGAIASGTVTTTGSSIGATANSTEILVQAPDNNTANLRVAFGSSCTSTTGIQIQPGRLESFHTSLSPTVCAESGTQGYTVQSFGQ